MGFTSRIGTFCALLLVSTSSSAFGQSSYGDYAELPHNTGSTVLLLPFDSAGIDSSLLGGVQNLNIQHNLRSDSTEIVLLPSSKDSLPTLILVPEPQPVVAVEPGPLPETSIAEPRSITIFPVALRTNLLFDIIGGPNIGVEVPIGEKFSVSGDFAYAYVRLNNNYAIQTIQGGIEGRYWFNSKEDILTGWNAGIYGMYCSRFDIQWKGGYQGDGFWSAGLSAGYAIPLSCRFNLDFSIAGGYIYTPEVRHYHKPENGKLIWQETRYDFSTISLTKVRVNLIWLIGVTKKVAR